MSHHHGHTTACSSVSDCPPRFDCPYTKAVNGTTFCRCHQFWGMEGGACDEETPHSRAIAGISVVNALCFALALKLAASTLRDRVRSHGVYRCDHWGAVDTTMLCCVLCLLANLLWAVGWVLTAMLVDHAFVFDTAVRPVAIAIAAITFVGALLNVSVMWLEVATDSIAQALLRKQRAKKDAQQRARSASVSSRSKASAAASAASTAVNVTRQQSAAAAQNLLRYRRHVLWATSLFGVLVVALLAMRLASIVAMLSALFAVVVVFTYRRAATKLSAKMLKSYTATPSAASSHRKGGASPRGAAGVVARPPRAPITRLEKSASLIVVTSQRIQLTMTAYVLGTACYVVGDRRDRPNAVTILGTLLIVQMNLWAMVVVQQYAETTHRLNTTGKSDDGEGGGERSRSSIRDNSDVPPLTLKRGSLASMSEAGEEEMVGRGTPSRSGSSAGATGGTEEGGVRRGAHGHSRGSIYDSNAAERARSASTAGGRARAASQSSARTTASPPRSEEPGGGGDRKREGEDNSVQQQQQEDEEDRDDGWIDIEVDGDDSAVAAACRGEVLKSNVF